MPPGSAAWGARHERAPRVRRSVPHRAHPPPPTGCAIGFSSSVPPQRWRRFRAAAAGPGVIPWQRDLDRLEEDFLLSLLAPADGLAAISPAGARILARRLRDAVARQQQRVLARAATADRSCPFDLQRLLPVPPAILRLGPDDPAARAWLWAHWGTTRALRQIRELPTQADRRRRQMDQLRVEFWAADWSPWRALTTLRHRWPDLQLALQPDYRTDG